MIGGIIVLTILLTALGTMVFVSQQYDSYQNMANKMSQFDIQRFSENMVADFPGLVPPSDTTSCGAGSCYQYYMILSNVGGLTNAGSGNAGISGGSGGGIGIEIVRVYINSTTDADSPSSSGCVFPNYCILNLVSTATPYGFKSSDSFLNPGEFNHQVTFWIPSSIGKLPNPDPPTPKNTIWIVTGRGRVFSFQWPFPPTGPASGGQAGSAVTTGVMKIAYYGGGYDSSLEGSTAPNAPYCHTEDRETLLGINGVTPTNSLTFVNPWIIDTIFRNTLTNNGNPGPTTLYVYTNVLNTRQTSITVTRGQLSLQAAASTENQKAFFLSGPLIGIYYEGQYYPAPTSQSIQPNENFYAIFTINLGNLGSQSSIGPLYFLGYAAISNQAKDGSYFAGEVLLDGLYDRGTC